jgi:hypothetical protein
MKKALKALVVLPFVKEIIGLGFIIVGLAGIILPILPGWIFIFYGMELLGLGFLLPVFVKNFMRKVERGVGIRKK